MFGQIQQQEYNKYACDIIICMHVTLSAHTSDSTKLVSCPDVLTPPLAQFHVQGTAHETVGGEGGGGGGKLRQGQLANVAQQSSYTLRFILLQKPRRGFQTTAARRKSCIDIRVCVCIYICVCICIFIGISFEGQKCPAGRT